MHWSSPEYVGKYIGKVCQLHEVYMHICKQKLAQIHVAAWDEMIESWCTDESQQMVSGP